MRLIGIGADGKQSLLPLYEKWIYESDLLVGGERQLAFFPDYKGEKKVIKGKLTQFLADLQNYKDKKVIIVASGDPLFYGIGGYLGSKLPIEIYPSVSSIQLAFAKMKDSWENAYFTSVHGRDMTGLAQRIDGRDKVVILTDGNNNPNKLAIYLKKYQMLEYVSFVAENLGADDQRYGWYSLDEMEQMPFSPLNVVILKKNGQGAQWSIGIDDFEFFQRKPEKGLITKKEVRVLSLSEMKLKATSIVWDIGTCTGSLAIEAAKIAKEGAVYAIEKSKSDIENCYENMKKFRVDFTCVLGTAPDLLASFPDPDAIFIGGTSGKMEFILTECCQRLKPNGRIVINAVTIETLTEAVSQLKIHGFTSKITLVQISRSKDISQLTRFEPLTPIFIIVGERMEGK